MIGLEAPKLAGADKSAERLTVSIALATYNGERFLLGQLESLARQSVLPDELVVSDDGSTDGTLEILEAFARSAPFDVRILSNTERLGYRKNFLKAAEACRCEIVFFCDQDDVWDENKISLMRDAFLNSDTMMAYHHAQLIDEAGNPIGSLQQAFPHSPWQHVLGMSIAFRRCLLVRLDLVSLSIDHNWPEFNLAHDQWVPLLASVFGMVADVDETLVGYRQHQGNVYGALKNPRVSFSERVRRRMKNRTGAFEVLAENCRANSRIFGELSREQDIAASWREKAQFAEKKFDDLCLLFVCRIGTYKAPSVSKRFMSFYKLFRIGGYTRRGYGSFGIRGAVRDVLLGVLLGP